MSSEPICHAGTFFPEGGDLKNVAWSWTWKKFGTLVAIFTLVKNTRNVALVVIHFRSVKNERLEINVYLVSTLSVDEKIRENREGIIKKMQCCR